MTKYNEQTKKHIYTWRETHHEQYKDYIKNKVAEHYEKNKIEILKRLKRIRDYKKEVERLSFNELF